MLFFKKRSNLEKPVAHGYHLLIQPLPPYNSHIMMSPGSSDGLPLVSMASPKSPLLRVLDTMQPGSIKGSCFTLVVASKTDHGHHHNHAWLVRFLVLVCL